MKNYLFVFGEDLLFARKQVFCSKRSKFLRDLTQWSFFSEILCMRSPQPYLQNSVNKFSESVDLKKNVKRPCFYLFQETRFSIFLDKYRIKQYEIREQVCNHYYVEHTCKMSEKNSRPY